MGVSRCEAWLAAKITGPSSRSKTSSPRTDVRTCERNSGSSPAFCTTSRAAMAGLRRAHSARKTVVVASGTKGSADRGTCERRPQRKPRAACLTSDTPPRSTGDRDPRPLMSRPR